MEKKLTLSWDTPYITHYHSSTNTSEVILLFQWSGSSYYIKMNKHSTYNIFFNVRQSGHCCSHSFFTWHKTMYVLNGSHPNKILICRQILKLYQEYLTITVLAGNTSQWCTTIFSITSTKSSRCGKHFTPLFKLRFNEIIIVFCIKVGDHLTIFTIVFFVSLNCTITYL